MVRLMPFPTARPHDPAIDAWLDARPEPLATLARTWFARLRACGDDVCELMHDGQATACVGDAAFAYVAVYSRHVSVGFYAGSELPDPTGLLEGTGRFMRHVKLRPDAPVDEAALEALVATAYATIRDAALADDS